MVSKKIYTKSEVKKIISDYKKLLKQKGVVFEKVYLFGSYAKNQPHQWSDIDVAVISRAFGKNFFTEQMLLDKIADNISYAIEPHPMHPKTLNDKWSALALEIKKYGKVV